MSTNETQSWRAPTPREGRNYPYNCWWVAALSSEVGRDLLGRWLLDTPVLLYRTEDGRAVAVENRCPHRAAPLSLGCLKGDNVQCGYHGFTFSPDGACVDAPSMGTALPAATIRSFPVIEQNAFVWVYLAIRRKSAKCHCPTILNGLTTRLSRSSRGGWTSRPTTCCSRRMSLISRILDMSMPRASGSATGSIRRAPDRWRCHQLSQELRQKPFAAHLCRSARPCGGHTVQPRELRLFRLAGASDCRG